MYDNHITTVGDAIAALSGYNPTTPLRIAIQPGYPMEHHLAQIVCTPDDAEGDGTVRTDPPVVWLGVGEQIGCLPALAASALGWSS
jgi:hypothetical protein